MNHLDAGHRKAQVTMDISLRLLAASDDLVCPMW